MSCDDHASIEALKLKLKFSDASKCSNPEAPHGFQMLPSLKSEDSLMAGNHLAIGSGYDRALDILGTSIEEEGPRNLFFNTQTSNSEPFQNRTEGYGTLHSKNTIVLDSNLGD